MHKKLYQITALALGLVFISSGLAKIVNIPAASNTVGVFCSLMGLQWLYVHRTAVAVILCITELIIGSMALSHRFRHYVKFIYLPVLVCFTMLTAANLLLPDWQVESCGCFGELIHFTPLTGFLKNIFLTVMASLLYIDHRRSM